MPIKDDFSRFSVTYLLRQKYDAGTTFRHDL